MPASSGDVDALLPSLKALCEVLEEQPWMCKDTRLAPLLENLATSMKTGETAEPPNSPSKPATDASSNSPATSPLPPSPGDGAAEEVVSPPKLPAGPSVPGCYLFATEEHKGTLYAWWSETPVEGAVAFMRPGKDVPKFKYTNKGGKNEIVREMRGPLIKNYYRGWASFIKNYVKAFDGKLTLFPPADAFPAGSLDVGVYLNKSDQSIEKIEANTEHGTLDGVVAVAVLDPNSGLFKGVQSMPSGMFIDRSMGAGYALSLQ
jgi:hypothetical protein